MKTISATGKNKGFSLVELMVAVVVVTLGLIFVLKAYGVCGQYIADAQNRMRAVLVLENLLGKLREKALTDYEEAVKADSGKEKVDQKEFSWTKETSAWQPSSQGLLSNSTASEDESESDSLFLTEGITQVQFTVRWQAKGEFSRMKMHTLMVQ